MKAAKSVELPGPAETGRYGGRHVPLRRPRSSKPVLAVERMEVGSERPTSQVATISRNGPLSEHQRAVVIEALASALVEDYLADRQALADARAESRRGINT